MRSTTLFLLAILILLTSPLFAVEKLKLGILPVIDTLPLQVALKDGYFKKENLQVELVPFLSAMERNTAVQSGQLDGYFGDMIATILMVDKDLPIKFLTVSYSTDSNQRMFALVTSPKFKTIPNGESLTVAISKATIIDYLLTYMEKSPEASSNDYQAVEIKQMPIRVQMLLAGKIDSALLPEPLVSLAVSKGAQVITTDQNLSLPLTVLNIHQNKITLRGDFLKAYDNAVKAINRNPEKYRDLMAKTCRIPKPLVASFPMYKYPLSRLPSEQEINQVQDWMIQKSLLKKRLAAQQFLP